MRSCYVADSVLNFGAALSEHPERNFHSNERGEKISKNNKIHKSQFDTMLEENMENKSKEIARGMGFAILN